jgi:thioredoxin reductase (NADPH)
VDLLVVGAGPTGIAVGAAARERHLSVLMVDKGPLTSAIQAYPCHLTFFTTRDRLEIAGVPFTVPEDKPSRRQALVYYRSVVERFAIPVALHEAVVALEPPAREGGWFGVETVHRQGRHRYRARAVVLATGYFDHPVRLGVPGEDLPWVHRRYHEPYRHFGDHVVVVGGGNTAVEAALDLWRNGVRVTLVHRGPAVKGSIKYWLKPDFENRVAEGSVTARYRRRVVAFREEGTERWAEARGEGAAGVERLPCDAAYVFIGYRPDVTLQRQAGVEVDADTLVPAFDADTCETNVPGLYVAGTLQAGVATDRIFIENSRHHAPLITDHLAARLAAGGGSG